MAPKYDLTRGIANSESIKRVAPIFYEALLAAREKYGDLSPEDIIHNYSAGTKVTLSGFGPLKETIAGWHKTTPDSVYITNGGMDANSKVLDAMRIRRALDGGGIDRPVILADRFMYDRMLQELVNQQFLVLGIPFDGKGPNPAKLEELIVKHHPIGVSTQPGANNPTGLEYSRARLTEIADMCVKSSIPILIDDAYQNASLGIHGTAPSAPIDISAAEYKTTIVTKNTTKELLPGLKIGYIACSPTSSLTGLLTKNVGPNSLLNGHYPIQAAWLEMIGSKEYENHIAWANSNIHEPRGHAVNDMLRANFSEHFSYGAPPGGFFTLLWIKGADSNKIDEIVKGAATYEQGVALLGGIGGIAPWSIHQQPKLDSVTGLISPTSDHGDHVIEIMGGAPLRLAFNHAPSIDALNTALGYMKDVVGHVMNNQPVPKSGSQNITLIMNP